jgi:tetratricopeptide (TPR) repeat protein
MARELLERSKASADGLVDPWRNNALAVQRLLDDEYVTVAAGPFDVQLHRLDTDVLQAYLLPIQLEAAEALGAKYGWRPEGRTRIEVLRTWDDFSVRTIGFRGFTALGVCFGRLITLVSPVDADVRRNDFMWEATAWHEYAHVLTLGLSENRVPRWLTEGFSVHEERARDPSWERGMDRELFDAFHNGDIPPVHLLNRLFRGPRILFGYYQGGLVVDWIVQHHGFQKALDLLRAYGEDLDTEAAFAKALGMTSKRFDEEFLRWIGQERLRGMRLVKRPDDAAMARLAARAAREPRDAQARVDLAWGCLQRDNPVDAGRWLAEAFRIDPGCPPAELARAELLRRRDDVDGALASWRKGFAGGADDFDSRIAFGRALLAAGDADGAIAAWQAAKGCWPACTEVASAPELLLARLYRQRGDEAAAMVETKAYCRRSARAFAPRYELATAARAAGDLAEAARWLVECNRIDPFHRELHSRLGEVLEAQRRLPEAAREFEVAAAVLPDFDRRFVVGGAERPDEAAERSERAGLWLRAARLRHGLGDDDRATGLLERIGREAAGDPAAATAGELLLEWRRK